MLGHPFRTFLLLSLVLLHCGTFATVAAQGPAAGNQNTLTASETSAGWKLLFDGRTLTGWTPAGESDWKVEDGTIAATKGLGFLVTATPYSNFELTADFWADKTVNSGIFFRCAEGMPSGNLCYELNIFDAHADWPTGSINNVGSTKSLKLNTIEKWNTLQLTAQGNHLLVKLNGVTTVDAQNDKSASGKIALQEGGANGFGLIRFRNIKIRVL